MCRRFLVLASALLMIAACSSGSASTGKSVPADASYKALDGSSASLASYKGTPVLVNFFSSTCEPCAKEMPALEQVKQEAGGKVRFVGIDVGDPLAATTSFVDAVKVTWDIGRDPDAKFAEALGATALPTTFVLGADGKILYQHLGQLDVDQLKSELTSRGLL